MEDLLIRLKDYFEDRMDADNGIPNEEMKFYNEIKNLLECQTTLKP